MEPVPDTFLDLFLGYTIIWAIIALFIFVLWRANVRLAKELVLLKEHAQRGSKILGEAAKHGNAAPQ